MTALPDWIDERLQDGLHNKLTQRHVVEVMLDSERPFFSVTQLQARLKPEVSAATVRNRLDELRELDVVAAEEYPDAITLYYLDHPESEWPLSPDGERALHGDAASYDLSLRGFLTLSNPADIRTLALAGFQLALVLVVVGVALTVAGVPDLVESDQQLWEAGTLVFGVSLVVLLAERVARTLRGRLRGRDSGPTTGADTA
jgi:hypothetical protein